MATMRRKTRAERNGFKSQPIDLRLANQTGRAPRRLGPMRASEPNKRLPPHPTDKRRARRAQRAARRITRARA